MTEHLKSFDDRIDDNLEKLGKKLHQGLCIPQFLIDQALHISHGEDKKFLQYVHDWLQKRKDNTDRYDLPMHAWEKKLNDYFPKIPENIKTSAKQTFPDDSYGQWRNIILCVLKLLISKNDKTDTSEVSEEILLYAPSDAVKDEVPFYPSNCISNFDVGKPHDFKETMKYKELLQKIETYSVMHTYGGRLVGKSFNLKALLHQRSCNVNDKLNVMWLFQCTDGDSVVMDELKLLIKKLKEGELISIDDADNLLTDESKLGKNLIELLHKIRLTIILAFEDVNVDTGDREMIRQITDAVLALDRAPKLAIQVITTAQSRAAIYDVVEMGKIPLFCECQISGFSPEEAIEYLKHAQSTTMLCYRYLADDRQVDDVSVYSDEGADKLIKYFDCNPGCLKLAMIYCMTRKISFDQYRDAMDNRISQSYVRLREKDIAMQSNQIDEKAYQALQMQFECNESSDDPMALSKRIMKILTCVNSEDIPILFIGKVCQHLRSDAEKRTPKENSELNKVEACETVYRMQELYGFENRINVKYPNGGVSIPRNIFDKERLAREEMASDLIIALKALVGMISKDNTERSSDMRLSQLRLHLEKVGRNAENWLKAHRNNKKATFQIFEVSMLVCRVHELLGQALIQGRISAHCPATLLVILSAARILWKVVCSYNTSIWNLCINSRDSADDLDYVQGRSAEDQGKLIAKQCMKAGKSIKIEYIENYLKSSLVFNKKNFSEFVDNAMEICNVSKEEAEQLLKGVKEMIDNGLQWDPSLFEIMRKTQNLLPGNKLRITFFAERLCSILHTYGRQVLYLQNKMSRECQITCEYYTELAHYIAKAVRIESGVGILFEYITVANAIVPRLLQNRENEDRDSRKTRLNEAYQKSKGLLTVPGKFYENSCYKRIEGTGYTNLNAYKYIVKASTKLLKFHKEDHLPEKNEECKELYELAKTNYSLDMAPHCMMQAARYFAATADFENSFNAFEDAFNYQPPGAVRAVGMLHLRDWRPNSFAWAVHNYAMAVKAYKEYDRVQSQAKISRAVARCNLALEDCKDPKTKISDHWKRKMENWLREFGELNM